MPFADFSFDHAALGFAGNTLDRMAAQRDHGSGIPALLDHPDTRFVALSGDRILLRGAPEADDPWFVHSEVKGFGTPTELVFLGRAESGAVFAKRFDPPNEESEGTPPVRDLRSMATAGVAPAGTIGILAEAKALLHWHRSHRFCSACGQPSRMAAWGWRRECPACGTHHFPRTDPVVIMMAVDRERCLLGRQPRFAPGMYSCLAGFLEPGETIEAAVRRELFEESGVTVGSVTYLASQPWPFPSSLMIGCIAEALTTKIVVDTTELEDVRWFDRAELRRMLAGAHEDNLVCPPPMAIAHGLMKAWADAG